MLGSSKLEKYVFNFDNVLIEVLKLQPYTSLHNVWLTDGQLYNFAPNILRTEKCLNLTLNKGETSLERAAQIISHIVYKDELDKVNMGFMK